MEEAERIAREEHGSVKLAVISGKFGHMRQQGL
jgi:histone acetyltransferase (RNA polymerase elongator complex component)